MYRSHDSPAALAATAALLAALMLGSPVWGQEAEDAPKPSSSWHDRAEVSLVATGGNSDASTVALRNTLTGTLGDGTLTIDAGALRAETAETSRLAVGTPAAFTVQETSVTTLTAENYLLRGRYDRPLSERLFWFAGAGWERNEFAGIKNRTSVSGGVGHVWFEEEKAHLRTDYGLTYTDQENVVASPGESDAFLGVRLGWNYLRTFGENASYGNILVLDGNADQTSDYRADMTNSLSVSISERLALQVSLQVLFDNQPSLAALPLFSAPGVPTGTTVGAPLDDLDTLFTVTLVVDF